MPSWTAYVRDKRSPRPKNAAVSALMSRIRSTNTKPERELRSLLSAAGVRGYRLHHATTPGRPDIAFVGRRIAVFVHGCFWHSCPHCKRYAPKHNSRWWRDKLTANRERDARKRRDLVRAGWKVLTIWECRLKEGPARELARVVRALG